MIKYFPFLILIFLTLEIALGRETEASHREALRDLAGRASQGEGKALFELARLHERGYDSIQVDSVRSTLLYLQSALTEYAPAMNIIGFKYFNGEGLRKDIDSAMFWLRKAGNKGDITAAANLGYLLSENPEIPHDKEESVRWLMIASEAGVRDAQLHLIQLMAKEWTELPPDSALYSGTKYYAGNAPYIGVKLIETAAKAGIPKALTLLGDAYSKGRGIPYDHKKSLQYFLEAAEKGDPSAQFILAELLDFFPDTLNSGGENNNRPISPLPLYEEASKAGITDSESAYKRLYDPNLP